jgi:hypothetical protein
MPAYISYVIPVSRVIRDAETNKLTFIDVFGLVIIPKGEDKTIQFFTIAGRLVGTLAGDAKVTVTIENEGIAVAKRELSGSGLSPGSIDFQARFDFVEFTKVGLHYIKVEYNGALLPDENRNYIMVLKQP